MVESINPQISVIIPFHNAANYFEQALWSVFSQKKVTIEVIAINDGSNDGSEKIAKSFTSHGLQLISQNNSGTATALNRGIQATSGTYISFLDADDYWVEDKLEKQYSFMCQHNEIDFVLGQMKHFISPELGQQERRQVHCPPGLMAGYSFGTMMIRRTSFSRVGLLNEEWRLGEFLDWYLRAIELQLKYICLPELALMRRIHRTNKGLVMRSARIDYLSIIHQSVRRKRTIAQRQLENSHSQRSSL